MAKKVKMQSEPSITANGSEDTIVSKKPSKPKVKKSPAKSPKAKKTKTTEKKEKVTKKPTKGEKKGKGKEGKKGKKEDKKGKKDDNKDLKNAIDKEVQSLSISSIISDIMKTSPSASKVKKAKGPKQKTKQFVACTHDETYEQVRKWRILAVILAGLIFIALFACIGGIVFLSQRDCETEDKCKDDVLREMAHNRVREEAKHLEEKITNVHGCVPKDHDEREDMHRIHRDHSDFMCTLLFKAREILKRDGGCTCTSKTGGVTTSKPTPTISQPPNTASPMPNPTNPKPKPTTVPPNNSTNTTVKTG